MADLLGPDGAIIALDVAWARTAGERARGLIGRHPGAGRALILHRARQVHTVGVSYPLDVAFCDRDWIVRHVCAGMRPRRISRLVWRARYAIEMPSPSPLVSLKAGDRVTIRG